MLQLDILTNLRKWGQVIAFKIKTQKKGMPVKWFSTSWSLKQCKKRERFQAIVMDIIQDCGQRKLIVYFNTWMSLDKTLNTDFTF
uniref:Uncharacterized protein n=1 Tax=Rhizophagus irregularis (strain DAOM 181602 / DAOM 197198 / MUCL 43194) TaxID=747089 RepID=U9URW8_RHIID